MNFFYQSIIFVSSILLYLVGILYAVKMNDFQAGIFFLLLSLTGRILISEKI